jgi:3-oxoacyl-[acyl-carrier protein] reductase
LTKSEGALQGRCVLVTGASRGIGRAASLLFASYGADVALIARSESSLLEAAYDIERCGRAALPIVADVAIPEHIEMAVGRVADAFGRLDVLVNNAGDPGPRGRVDQISIEEWHCALAVNLSAVFMTVHFALPLMLSSAPATVINVGGGSREHEHIAYSSAKSGVMGLTRSLAKQLESEGVSVNGFGPGRVVSTDMVTRGGHIDERAGWLKPKQAARDIVALAILGLNGMTGAITVGLGDGALYQFPQDTKFRLKKLAWP